MEHNRNAGPPPSIGHMRGMGIVALNAHCLAAPCGHGGRVLLEVLGLPDETPWPEIARRRRLVCSRCGVRTAEISPDWRDHAAQGGGAVRRDD